MTESDFPLSSTFGPRVHDDPLVYDFHRGIDIARPVGTDVHAIADGKVTQILNQTSLGGQMVVIQHSGYSSVYVHLSEVDVEEGDKVDVGDTIGLSGKASNGFAHLHFEIRRPGDDKKDSVHPLEVLPYADRGAPKLALLPVDMSNPSLPQVTAKVTVPATELDLVRIEAASFDVSSGTALDGLTPLAEQAYDVDQWNSTYTQADSDALVDDPNLQGISVAPVKFSVTASEWTTSFAFKELTGASTAGMFRVRVRATDARGNVAEVVGP
jgi:hypothetical protein